MKLKTLQQTIENFILLTIIIKWTENSISKQIRIVIY